MRAQLVGINKRITIHLDKEVTFLAADVTGLKEDPQNKRFNLYAHITSNNEDTWTFTNTHTFMRDGTMVTVNNQSFVPKKILCNGDEISIRNEYDYIRFRFEIKYDVGSLIKGEDPPVIRKDLPIMPTLSI